MYSVYFSNESAGDRASNLRTSCLRSSNRSFRKSLPSQVNKSNAKKHGGFPRWNIRFLNCGLPRLSREQIFTVNDRSCVRQGIGDCFCQRREGSERMPIAREQPSVAMLDHGECSESVVLQLEDPLRIIECQGPLQERHW